MAQPSLTVGKNQENAIRESMKTNGNIQFGLQVCSLNSFSHIFSMTTANFGSLHMLQTVVCSSGQKRISFSEEFH